MDKLRMHSFNQADENYRVLADLFPSAVTEVINPNTGETVRAIDKDILMQEISTYVVEGKEERYQFTWPDKKKAILLSNAPISLTLRPVVKDSVGKDGKPTGWDSENIYIEGDNLDALKLLQETYLKKIKMIYIDPPYNTGSDLVYEDDFAEKIEEYFTKSGQFDDQGNRLEQNTESNGRFHTDWLNMIYPRIRLAKNLLTDDGVIAISIDDNEVQNLRNICDEIFGKENFIAEFPRVTKRGGKSTSTFAKNHDYVLVYCKNHDAVSITGVPHIDEGFKNKDEHYEKRGPYKLNQTLDYNTLQYNVTMDYPLTIDGKVYVPGGDVEQQEKRHSGQHGIHDWVWRWSKQKFDFGYKNDWIVISNSGRIYTKTYLNATIDKDSSGNYQIVYTDRTRPVSTLDTTNNEYSNDNSAKEFISLMGKSLFEYVKPTALVKLFIKTCCDQNALILDFFSGSGTTADAVMQLNAEDGGHRRFIMVQLPEKTEEKTEANIAGYENICEIGKERIRRAGKKIKEEAGVCAAGVDTGFRVFRLDSSNMQDVYYNPESLTRDLLDETVDNIKIDRSAEDLLFQVMLDLGVDLSSRIEEHSIDDRKVFVVKPSGVDKEYLVACFDKGVTSETVTAIAKMQPYYAVFRDNGMASDSVATNFDQIFRTYSPQTERRVL